MAYFTFAVPWQQVGLVKNLVTAIAGAYYDSVPIRCTMGRVATDSREKVESI
jgi:hypothetical protein